MPMQTPAKTKVTLAFGVPLTSPLFSIIYATYIVRRRRGRPCWYGLQRSHLETAACTYPWIGASSNHRSGGNVPRCTGLDSLHSKWVKQPDIQSGNHKLIFARGLFSQWHGRLFELISCVYRQPSLPIKNHPHSCCFLRRLQARQTPSTCFRSVHFLYRTTRCVIFCMQYKS